MGIETAILAATAVSAAGSIYGGIQANNEAKTAADMERFNAAIADQETQQSIRSRTEEMTRLKETQKMAMLKSGMGLAGSQLLMLEDTKRQLALDVNQLELKNDIAKYNSSVKADSILRSGRAAMIGGYAKAAGTMANYSTGKVKVPSTTGSTSNVTLSPKFTTAWNGYSYTGNTTTDSGYTGLLGGLS